jgi:hypothetical protein
MALRKHKNYTPEDLSAALTLTSLTSGEKRQLLVDLKDDRSEQPKKKLASDANVSSVKSNGIANREVVSSKDWVLKPAPYFYYNDRSREPDDDPLTPLTPPGLIPTFPAKVNHDLYIQCSSLSFVYVHSLTPKCLSLSGYRCMPYYQTKNSQISSNGSLTAVLGDCSSPATLKFMCYPNIFITINCLRLCARVSAFHCTIMRSTSVPT